MDFARLMQRAAELRLETERLWLRRLTPADVDIAVAHELDPQIMRFIRDVPTPEAARSKVLAFLEPWHAEEGRWLILAIVPKDSDRMVGPMVGIVGCRVTTAAHEAMELGYRLHPDVHGRGYASEASQRLADFLFDDIGLHKLIALCTAENTGSYRVMEKLGMQREGLLRQHARIGGRWHDELVYGLLADERRR
jgi:RimJ/RimL family protein N-acetyltransferase